MNLRGTYVLLGLVVLALVVLAGYVMFTGDDKPPVSTEGYLLKSFRAVNVKKEDVTSVEIERPGLTPDKVAFTRTEKGWQMTAPSKARADSDAIEDLVNGLLSAKSEKSADIGPNLASHGLDNPPVKVTLRTKDLSDTIALGNVTIGGDQAVVYVTTSDRPDKAQAAKKSTFRALFKVKPPENATTAGQLVKEMREFRPVRLLGVGLADPTSQVLSAAVREGDDQLAVFKDGDTWRFREPKDFGDAIVEPDGPGIDPKESKTAIASVRQLLNTMMDVRPGTHEQLHEGIENLAKFGLGPNAKPMQLDFSRADGTQETVYVGEPVKDDKVDRFYARHEGDLVVAEVNATAVRDLQRALKAKHLLRDRTVLKLAPNRIDAIDILTNGETIALRFANGQWKIYESNGTGRPARKEAVDQLLGRLTARQLATGFPSPAIPEDKRGFAKPTAEVKLWEGGVVPEAKPDPTAMPKVTAPPTARIQFGHKDVGNVVFGRRYLKDAKADFFVPQDAADLASRDRLAYIAGSLKQFAADKVRKLSFTYGKDTIELERPDDDKPTPLAAWKINGPASLKGRSADPFKVHELINQISVLSFLQPKVAADKPTDDILNRLEFNPPRLKVMLSVKEAGDITYLFGGDVGTEKKAVYLKPLDGDLVFEVERSVFDLYLKADVQDTVVHRLDKTKIKGVKLTGWQDIDGTPKTLEFERKDGKWAIKAGGMFELDPVKVDLFLSDLTTPRAESFLIYKTGPKPEHNLDVAKGALNVELALEMGDPVKMTLSAPNKDGRVVATSSLSAGDVFTLADRFAMVRAKPASFKKD